MKKRISAFLLTLAVLFVGFALPAAPAQASSVYGCGDGWICFYNYESFNSAGGVWGHRIAGSGNWNTCITMPSSGIAGWTGGTTYNAASSIFINNTGTNTIEVYSHFWDGYNCSGQQMFGEWTAPNSLETGMWRLANYSTYPSGNANDRIGSFMVNTNP